MKRVYINGYFTSEPIHGVPRYSMEIVKRLDSYFKPGDAVLVIPKNAKNIPRLNNIEISTWETRGRKKETGNVVLWGELVYRKSLEKGCVSVNLSNRQEWVKNSITAIHDIIPLQKFRYGIQLNYRERIRKCLYDNVNKFGFYYKMYVKKYTASIIITSSEFSKKEICRKLNINENKLVVIGDGWEHIKEIEEIDEGKVKVQKKFFLIIGSVLPHKNLKWILNEAKYMPNEYFIIAGHIPKRIRQAIRKISDNVIFLGRISDGYMKFLMKNCKALLFPSLLEGFGIPPLEQLALGGETIVADIPVMREIYKDSVHYIDPMNGKIDLNKVLAEKISGPEQILNEYTWEMAAKKLFDLIERERKYAESKHSSTGI